MAEALERAGGPTRRADLTAREPGRAACRTGSRSSCRGAGGAGRGGAAAARGRGSAGHAPAAPKLSLAAATVEQLDELDGIGPTLAERIVEYRDAQGGFRSLDELREVDGIGEKRFATPARGAAAVSRRV